MPTPQHDIDDDETACPEESSAWPVVITASSALLGYFLGRISYSRDLQTVLRRIETASDPVEITIRTL